MEWVTTSAILEDLHDFENETAWRSLVERFRTPIVEFAGRMGIPESECGDVAQETLIEFAKAYQADKYDPERGRLRKWLFGIAYRQIQNRRRKMARERSHRAPFEPLESELADETRAGDLWEAHWQRYVYQACLRQAREEFQSGTFQAFALVVLEGKRPDEAARILGVRAKSVYNAKHRVLQRVRELHREIEDLDPAAGGSPEEPTHGGDA